MTLSTKLLLNALLPLLAALIAGAIAWHTQRTVDELGQVDLLVIDIVENVFEQSTLTHDFVNDPTLAHGKQWQRKHFELEQLLSAAKNGYGAHLELLESIHLNHEQIAQTFIELSRSIRRNLRTDDPGTRLRASGQYDLALAESIVTLARSMAEEARTMSLASRRHSSRERSLEHNVMAVSVGILLLVLSITAWSVRGRVLARVAELRAGTAAISAGDLGHRIALRGNDELTSLAASFNAMSEQLQVSGRELNSEIEMRRDTEALAARAQARLRTALESISQEFALFDRNDRLVVCNERYARRFSGEGFTLVPGVTFERMLREALARGDFPQAAGREAEWLESVLTRHRGPPGSVEVRTPEDGWVLIDKHSTPDDGTVILRTDISELKRREAELSRSNAELEQFAFIASHDLHEPLRKIRVFGDRLQQTCAESLGERGVDYLARMTAAAERMGALIDDLLMFSRVSQHGADALPVDLNLIARSVLSDLDLRIQECGAEIELGTLPVVCADPRQMRQLFQNLIANALKFRRDDLACQVRVSADPERARGEGFCRLTFGDNGIGFEPQYAERIFEVFQRLHSRSEYPGTGIGLAICRKIAEHHGGGISASATPGGGAQFVVTLKAGAAAQSAA